MTHYEIQYYTLAWCDKCTEEVTTTCGEEKGAICPTCQTGFYLESLQTKIKFNKNLIK